MQEKLEKETILERFKMPSAEERFKEFALEKGIEIERGLPDFMIIKNGEVVGFVEVKRDDWNDDLRENQKLFMRFCRKHKIPYQVWSPIMAGKRFAKIKSEDCKNRMRYAKEDIWDMI